MCGIGVCEFLPHASIAVQDDPPVLEDVYLYHKAAISKCMEPELAAHLINYPGVMLRCHHRSKHTPAQWQQLHTQTVFYSILRQAQHIDISLMLAQQNTATGHQSLALGNHSFGMGLPDFALGLLGAQV